MSACDAMCFEETMRDYEELKRDVLETDYNTDELKRIVLKLICYNKDLTKKLDKERKSRCHCEKLVCLLEDCLSAFMEALKDQFKKAKDIQASLTKVREFVYKTVDSLTNTENLVKDFEHKTEQHVRRTQTRLLSESVKYMGRIERQSVQMQNCEISRGRRTNIIEQVEALRNKIPVSSSTNNQHQSPRKRRKSVSSVRGSEAISYPKRYKKLMNRLGSENEKKKSDEYSSQSGTAEVELDIHYTDRANNSSLPVNNGVETVQSKSLFQKTSGQTRQRNSLKRRKPVSPISPGQLRTKVPTARNELFSVSDISLNIETKKGLSTLRGDELHIVLHDVLKHPNSEHNCNTSKQNFLNMCVSSADTSSQAEIIDVVHQSPVEYQNSNDCSNIYKHENYDERESNNLNPLINKKNLRGRKHVTSVNPIKDNSHAENCDPSFEIICSEINDINSKDHLNDHHSVCDSDAKDASNEVTSYEQNENDNPVDQIQGKVNGKELCTSPPFSCLSDSESEMHVKDSPCDSESEVYSKEADEVSCEITQVEESPNEDEYETVDDACNNDNEKKSNEKDGLSEVCEDDTFIDVDEADCTGTADDDDDDDDNDDEEEEEVWYKNVKSSKSKHKTTKGPRTPPGTPPADSSDSE